MMRRKNIYFLSIILISQNLLFNNALSANNPINLNHMKQQNQDGLEIKKAAKNKNNWCLYHYYPISLGYWTLYRKGIDPDIANKRVLLLVHGHDSNALFNVIKLSLTTKLLPQKTAQYLHKHLGTENNKFYFALNDVINIARMMHLNAKAPHDLNKPRFDIIIGYAYNTGMPLETICKQAADQWAKFLKDAKSVDIIAHSMGGLTARGVLELYGLGKKFKNLITISSPHQGIAFSAKPFQILKSLMKNHLISTLDMITASPEIDDPNQSEFLKRLNKNPNYKSPYYETANYYAIVGTRYANMTYNTPQAFNLISDSKYNIGSIIQSQYNYMFPNKMASDGLVPTYSSGSDVLKRVSKSFAENPDHLAKFWGNHRTVAGNNDNFTGVFNKDHQSTQYMLQQQLLYWIKKWSYAE